MITGMKISCAFFVGMVVFISNAARSQQQSIVNAIGMEFVLIEPGSMVVGKFHPPYPVPEDTVKGADRPMMMWMGEGRSYNAEEFRLAKQLAEADAMEGFIVNLSSPYYIGKYEVTQAQWQKVMGENPSVFQRQLVSVSDEHPVDNVTWEDVQRFLARLNEQDRGRKYRLPTIPRRSAASCRPSGT